MPTSVLVIDDNVDITQLVCMAITAAGDMQVVGELNSVDNLLEEVRSKQPDVLILDLTLPGANVLDELPRVAQASPETRVVVYSGYDDQHNVNRAIDAGAWGYVSKNVDLDALLGAIRQVASGKVVMLR